jgi:hypothetical protein
MSVRVEIVNAAPGNAKVTTSHQYAAQVTLSIENADGSLTPSGWSTRKEGGGDGKPFSFTPGQNLIAGWTEGVLQMREGERAKIRVPVRLPAWWRVAARRGAARRGERYTRALRALLSRAEKKPLRNPRPLAFPRPHARLQSSKGYGAAAQGSKGGAWYIPANSNLLFDIEIVGKSGSGAPEKEL